MANFYARYNGGIFGGGGGGGGGTGDVVGPASATDKALVRFDGTTGKLIQNSTVVVTDLGAATGFANISATGATLSGLTASQAVVTDGSKNLASLAYGTASSASSLVERDANQNAFANNFTSKGTNVVSDGNTTTLTAASSRLQNLTGTLAQTFQLPDATTLTIGSVWEFDNNSSGVLSVTDGAGGALGSVPSGGYARFKATAVSTAAGAWDWHYLIPKNSSWGTAGATVTGTLTATGATTLSNYGAGVAQLSSAGLISSTAPGTSGNLLTSNGTAWVSSAPATAGTVTAVSVATANGLAGSSSGGATPALTLSTTVTGVLKGNATAISAATAGTDYSAGTSGLATGILKSTTTTGALTIAASGTDYQAPISSTTPVSHQFLTGFTSPNTFAQAQPAFTDISGTATVAQTTIAAQAISSTAIDWSTGNVFTQSNGATSRTFTFSNQTSGQTIVVRLTQTSGGVTWPTVKWPGGTIPTPTASGTDVYTFVYDGTSTYGSAVQGMA